ncbi:MAG: triose-phosphate isomerase [Polyangiaceae bacterium]|nr:triose-phosphate isomerase [Polyangiaceae bacterium]
MSNRTPLIAGNWKMNAGGQDGLDLAKAVAGAAAKASVTVVVSPPSISLGAVAKIAEAQGGQLGVAAQNIHEKESGAFTGEISAGMAKGTGAGWTLVGHSERRQYFGESDEQVGLKVAAALQAALRPIACIGETLEEREANQTLEVCCRQVDAFSEQLKADPGHVVIAYEPVWAIGTGKVATPEQAQEVHAGIRAHLAKTVGEDVAAKTLILYGGSVKPANAAELLSCADIDGALVGGASLKAESFIGIIEAV